MQLARSLPATRWQVILIGSLIAIGVGGLVWSSHHYPGLDGDWMSYRATLDRLVSGGPLYPAWQSEPYNLIDAAWGRGYVYPPSSVPMLPLAAWIDPWRVLNLGVLLGGTWLATRSPIAVALMLAFPATWATWANGQSMPLIVGLYGVAYGAQARWPAIAAGAVKLFPLTLLILAWRRHEPLKWPIVATGVIAVLAVPFLPVYLNAEPICHGQPILALQCREPLAAYAIGGLLLAASMVVRSDRLAFAMLCLAPFALAPDWTWAYWLLPMLAVLVLGTHAANAMSRSYCFRLATRSVP